MTDAQVSGSNSRSARPAGCPALLTRMSSRPSSPRSTRTASTAAPVGDVAGDVAGRPGRIGGLAEVRRRPRGRPRPPTAGRSRRRCPRAPPVTTTTWPSNRPPTSLALRPGGRRAWQRREDATVSGEHTGRVSDEAARPWREGGREWVRRAGSGRSSRGRPAASARRSRGGCSRRAPTSLAVDINEAGLGPVVAAGAEPFVAELADTRPIASGRSRPPRAPHYLVNAAGHPVRARILEVRPRGVEAVCTR